MFSFLARLPIWLLLSISAAGVVAGDYFAKYWSLHPRTLFAALAVGGYAISSFFYIPTLLKEGLVITSIIWVTLSIIGFLFIGIYFFQETLSLMQWVGVGLGVISIFVLSIAH